MNHYVFEKNKFLEDVDEIRKILTDRESDKFLFKKVDLNNLPIDGLFIYIK